MVANFQTMQDYSYCIENVKLYIREHINEPLQREVLAEVAGFSIPHFHRVFTAQTGESAASYVRRMRLERAGRKLRMGAVDITEVAFAAGYESHAAFGKAFKQQFGLSPSDFRQLDCWAATQILTKG
ncbi:MAG: helix-turn-helix transcriptional regulator [Chloroflexi bacterium]|nr:helix-turn-helix transcriptional regulator [Chloroflexota bacterium]MBI3170692.1 helix-turn-helix transcriptional regulator [Chloroflexota bacterium]